MTTSSSLLSASTVLAEGGRVCKTCNLFKPVAEMAKSATCAGGIRPHCKECRNAKLRAEFVADDAHRARVAAWRAANPERRKEHELRGRQRNAARRNQHSREYRLANLEDMRARGRAWSKNNPARANQINANRRAAKLRATPSWAESELEQLVISEAYRLAQLRTQMTSGAWHVDHIVPLRSDRVCGLHCAANLQVIPASVNQSKNNLVWPDMTPPQQGSNNAGLGPERKPREIAARIPRAKGINPSLKEN